MENNFKDLKDRILKGVFDSSLTGTKNKDLKKFIEEVKKSPILKEQLDIYTLVENEKFETKEDALFILERAMRVFDKYSCEDIKNVNKQIVENFGGTFDENDGVYQVIYKLYSNQMGKHDYSNSLGFLKPIIETMVIEKPLIKENAEDIPVPTKKELKRATALLNEKYSFFNETEKNIFKSFITNNEAEKESAYIKLLHENLNLVKRKLFESDDNQLDEKLQLIEEKLKTDSYNPDKKIEDFVKLLDLTKTLN